MVKEVLKVERNDAPPFLRTRLSLEDKIAYPAFRALCTVRFVNSCVYPNNRKQPDSQATAPERERVKSKMIQTRTSRNSGRMRLDQFVKLLTTE
jgi:hypothetical protein